jgi:hypothetical protein
VCVCVCVCVCVYVRVNVRSSIGEVEGKRDGEQSAAEHVTKQRYFTAGGAGGFCFHRGVGWSSLCVGGKSNENGNKWQRLSPRA